MKLTNVNRKDKFGVGQVVVLQKSVPTKVSEARHTYNYTVVRWIRAQIYLQGPTLYVNLIQDQAPVPLLGRYDDVGCIQNNTIHPRTITSGNVAGHVPISMSCLPDIENALIDQVLSSKVNSEKTIERKVDVIQCNDLVKVTNLITG